MVGKTAQQLHIKGRGVCARSSEPAKSKVISESLKPVLGACRQVGKSADGRAHGHIDERKTRNESGKDAGLTLPEMSIRHRTRILEAERKCWSLMTRS